MKDPAERFCGGRTCTNICRGLAKFLFASSQKCDSPLEVTRFEFTIKSCRCTKTCEGVGTSDFCKAEIVPFPYNSEIITNSEHGRTLFAPTVIWASPTSAKSLRSLRIYVALRARKAVQILYSDITFI